MCVPHFGSTLLSRAHQVKTFSSVFCPMKNGDPTMKTTGASRREIASHFKTVRHGFTGVCVRRKREGGLKHEGLCCSAAASCCRFSLGRDSRVTPDETLALLCKGCFWSSSPQSHTSAGRELVIGKDQQKFRLRFSSENDTYYLNSRHETGGKDDVQRTLRVMGRGGVKHITVTPSTA